MIKLNLFKHAMEKRHNINLDIQMPDWLWLIPMRTLVPVIDAYTQLPNPVSLEDMIIKFVMDEVTITPSNSTPINFNTTRVSVNSQLDFPYKSPWRNPYLAQLFDAVILYDKIFKYTTCYNINLDNQCIGYEMVFHADDSGICVCDWSPEHEIDFFTLELLISLLVLDTYELKEIVRIWPDSLLSKLVLSSYTSSSRISTEYYLLKRDVDDMNLRDSRDAILANYQ